jgi:hypothetical protein
MAVSLIKAGGSLNPIKSPMLLLPIYGGVPLLLSIRIIDRRRNSRGLMDPRPEDMPVQGECSGE